MEKKIRKVTVHAGHNPSGKIACGASDYLDESTEARVITKRVISMLRDSGIIAVNCTENKGVSQSDVLYKICNRCNAETEVDLNISIHFNAAAHSSKKDNKNVGTEVWCKKTDGIRGDVAKRICNQMSKIGFTNRGVKITDNLYFLNRTTKPSILVEVCFVTDPDDAALYTKNKDAVAKAIVKAILNYNKAKGE